MSLISRIYENIFSKGPKHTGLDQVIPAEISGDGFARLVTSIASQPDVLTALDVGASNGQGSTKALYEGLKSKGDSAQLYALEISENRFNELRKSYEHAPWVKCINDGSIPLSLSLIHI